MGGGNDEKICLIAEIAGPDERAVLDLRKSFPNVTFILYKMSVKKVEELFVPGRKNPIPDDIWKKTDYLITLSTFPSSLDLVPNLKWVHLLSAGVNQVMKNPIYTKTDDIIITTSSGIHGPQISEWVIMNMLIGRRRYDLTYEWQKKHEWGSHAAITGVKDHVGNRIGILGYGSIGRQAGHICKAMGMDVYAYTFSPRTTPESRVDNGFIVPRTGDPDGTIPTAWFSGASKSDLHTFLSQNLDYLVISVPLTPETTNMIAEAELEILAKSKAFILNIARGPILNSKALLKALNEEKLSGAALDVTDPEPLPKDDPLWDAKNVHISPHISGTSTKYLERSIQVWKGNLERYRESGQGKMWNVVNRKKGY